MWTAKLVYKKFENGKLVIGVEYTNGAEIIREDAVISNPTQTIKSIISARINQLNTLANQEKDLILGNVDLTPDPVPPAPVLTPEQIAQQQFKDDYLLWQRVKKAIDMGLLTGNETKVIALKTKVVGEFKPDYLELL